MIAKGADKKEVGEKSPTEHFDHICKTNKELIEKGKASTIAPCVLLCDDKNKALGVVPFTFTNDAEKDDFIEQVHKIILTQGIKKYYVIMDTMMTTVNPEEFTSETVDALIQTYYTPSEFKLVAMQYKDDKILDTIEQSGRKDAPSIWDVWATEEYHDLDYKTNLLKDRAKQKYLRDKKTTKNKVEGSDDFQTVIIDNEQDQEIEDSKRFLE